MKRWVSIFILVAFVVVAAIYLINQPELIEVLKEVSPYTIILLIFVRLMYLATNGLFLSLFASKFNIQLRFIEWFGLPMVTSFGNYITPFSGGLFARAAYLKRRHDFSYGSFATLLASNYLIAFWVVGFVGFISVFFIPGMTQSNRLLVGGWFLAVVVGITILFLVPTMKIPGKNRLSNLVNTSLAGWQLIRVDRFLVLKLAFLTLVNILLDSFAFWLAYQAVNETVHFLAIILISMLSSFSILINITPANLGINEAAITLASTLLGTGTGTGLVVALLMRATTILVVFTLGPTFSYLLARELTDQSVDNSIS
jgi:uncharacterized protein (TIRG00374 family)